MEIESEGISPPYQTDPLASEVVAEGIHLVGHRSIISSLLCKEDLEEVRKGMDLRGLGTADGSSPLGIMVKTSHEIHLPSKRELYSCRLVMDHRILHITVVYGLVMGKITSDSHPMAFFEIYPVR